MLCGSTTGGIPGSTSTVGVGGVDGAAAVDGTGAADLDANADIAEESSASSVLDTLDSAATLASAEPEVDVPTVPAGEPSEREHPASSTPDTKSTNVARRRVIDPLCLSRPHLRRRPESQGTGVAPDSWTLPIPAVTPRMDDANR